MPQMSLLLCLVDFHGLVRLVTWCSMLPEKADDSYKFITIQPLRFWFVVSLQNHSSHNVCDDMFKFYELFPVKGVMPLSSFLFG